MSGGARIAIIGAGSWGTALAIVLAPRFESIRLWAHEADLVERMFSTRINDVFLPGFSLPLNVEPTADLGYALADARHRSGRDAVAFRTAACIAKCCRISNRQCGS